MTETERAILKSLVDLESAVQSMPTTNPKPNLMPLFVDAGKQRHQVRLGVGRRHRLHGAFQIDQRLEDGPFGFGHIVILTERRAPTNSIRSGARPRRTG